MADIRPTDGGADVTGSVRGHPQPMVLRANGAVQSIGRTGPIVGQRVDACLYDAAVLLAAGDTLVMFTDGTLESIAGRGATDNATIGCRLSSIAGSSA